MAVQKKKPGVLGATGSVGQRLILLLANHPEIELAAVGASSRSAGKLYKDAVRWKKGVFKAEIPVFSNAKNYRKDPIVPLVVPTVNIQHLDLIPHQRKHYDLKKGFLFGLVEDVEVFTKQAVSGAGYPGIPSMDIMDNVIRYIAGEADKLENEAQKILGAINSNCTACEYQQDLTVGATCTRVGVTDGHMAFVSLRFKNRNSIPSAEQVKQAMRVYVAQAQKLGCSSAPQQAIVVFDEPDRPQPRLDRDISGGYAVSVGRVRETAKGSHFDIRFVCLSHNTVIGAAGSSILNAKAAILKGFIWILA